MRVRAFTQDDGHIFCSEDQIQSECMAFNKLALDVYRDFGFTEVAIKLALRPEKRLGDDAQWDTAEEALGRRCEPAARSGPNCPARARSTARRPSTT